jgi:single-strand DNA-binding protein
LGSGKGDFMNHLNSILIEGNLARDPLFRTTEKGTFCTFSLAYSRIGNGEKEISLFDVETWAKLAKSCNEQGYEGRGVRVVGRIRQNKWIDANGMENSKMVIVAEHVEFRPEFARAVPS